MVFIVLFLIGLIIGSFVNAWVWRVRNNKSIAKGRSECPKCQHELSVKDLIPLLSYLWLGGKCRYCKKHISLQYPIVEFCTGLLFVVITWHFQPLNQTNTLNIILWCVASVFLVSAFVYDLKYMQLPDRFMLPVVFIGGVLLTINASQNGIASIVPQLIAAFVFTGAYLVLWWFSKGKFLGDGDIRLAAIMGLLLSVPQLLVAIFVAYLSGALVGVLLIATNNKTRSSKIALGPFLIGGLYFGLFFGAQIANWYLAFFKL